MADVFKSEFGNFVIEISDDKCSAYLTVSSDGDFLNEKELVDLIAKSNIEFGFDEAKELVLSREIEKESGKPFPLAIGIQSRDTEVEFSPLFDNEKCYHPSIGDQFHLLKDQYRVAKGEPLAHLFVTKQCKVGKNIYGEEVVPEMYEQQIIDNYLGDNVSYSNERGQIIAEKSGYPFMDELSRIHVKSEFVLDKNLDLSVKDIDFFGSLVINGDIIDNIRLKLEGNLTVNGDINVAEIDVNGDVNVDGDIIDCKNAGVVASGNIKFKSAENSKIVAGDKISFRKNIQFCKVVAENGLFGNQENSTIVGGICQSGEHIEAAVLGNTGAIGTEIEISISPYTKEQMQNISKQMMKLRELKLTTSKEYLDLQEEQSSLEIKLEDAINNILKNQENLPKHIMAFKKVFPGTYLRILRKSTHITEELNKVSFSIVNGELMNESY